MATNTTNYNFKKPDESDFYSIQDQNGNWDKADAALKDVDTPTFEDYSGSMTVPDAATAINSIRSKGKLSTILSNMKAAFKGACLIGQIVNNCVTNNAKLPLSAAQGKALMDLYTQLNSDLAKAVYSSNLMAPSDGPVFLRWDVDTLNTPFKAGLTYNTAGFAFVYGDYSNYQTVVAFVQGQSYFFIHSVDSGNVHGWKKFPAN
ncbi:hypothetical protein CE91St54_41540 [Hungatella hathewayi]|nr:hypothetical protein [Hungatella hathewayi]GKH09046.1 hypothetical protein CE91St54_41540 [Hungatella hathewayi]